MYISLGELALVAIAITLIYFAVRAYRQDQIEMVLPAGETQEAKKPFNINEFIFSSRLSLAKIVLPKTAVEKIDWDEIIFVIAESPSYSNENVTSTEDPNNE